MAVPPSIPTSFVPKQPVSMHPRQMESGNNMFLIVSLVIGGIVILISIGVFVYAHILSTESAQKAAALTAAQSSVSEDTVESFLRLRNRLTESESILATHVMLSQFFDSLESLTLTDVRFTSLGIIVNDDRSATLKLTGTAKTFNALAAQSAAFATQPLIKQAIFSGINADKNGVVSFTVNATLDPRIVQMPAGVPASWTGASTGMTATTTTTETEAATTTATTTP